MKLSESEQQALLTIADGAEVQELREVVSDEVTGDDRHVVREWAGKALESGAAIHQGIFEECEQVYDKANNEIYDSQA